jgi:hypothetical protein
LSQKVILTGFNTHKFKAAIEATALISDLFVQSLGAGRFLQWTPDRFQTWRAVTISNKYFGSGRSARTSDLAKINPLVDPEGILASLGASGLHHTTDNQVGYFERVKTGESSFK